MFTIDFLIARHARHRSRALALVCGNRRLTFADLEAELSKAAGLLVKHGAKAGQRVAVLSGNRPEVVAVLLAAGRTGAVAVPLNTRWEAGEQRAALACAEPRLIVTESAYAAVAREYAASHPDAVVVELGVGGLPAAPPVSHSEAGLVTSDASLVLLFTSGTTDTPKGVVLTHANLLASAISTIVDRGLGSDETYLSGLPLFHVGGIVGLLPFLLMGRPTVLLPTGRFDAAATLDVLEAEAVTTAYLVPTQWADVVAEARRNARRLDLRRATYGGSPALRSLVEDLSTALGSEVAVVNSFGQTELSGAACVLQGEAAVRKHGSVGSPVSTVELRVVGPGGEDVADGDAGELLYRGPTVMQGYWRDEEATGAAFQDGWFRSGDVGRRDSDGDLWILGRRGDLILSGGENVSPVEVEEAVRAHPAVADVAVVAAPHPHWVEAPVAVVVVREGTLPPTADDLRAHCASRLARYKAPRAVVLIDALPRNSLGKVLRADLRNQVRATFTEESR